jgi:hypothetical protein
MRNKVRSSTLVLSAVFVVVLVLFILVRPG